MPKVQTSHRQFDEQIDRLSDLLTSLNGLSSKHQKLAAEIIMLRLFSVCVYTFESVIVKLLCGATYCDGSSATLAIQSASASVAITNMKTHGRTKSLQHLRWTQAKDIRENTKHILRPTEHVINVINTHATLINEMRHVRNHIAHTTSDTRKKFNNVVFQRYGAKLNSLTPGTLLLTPRWTPNILNQYFSQAKILMRTAVKG